MQARMKFRNVDVMVGFSFFVLFFCTLKCEGEEEEEEEEEEEKSDRRIKKALGPQKQVGFVGKKEKLSYQERVAATTSSLSRSRK